MEELRNNIRRDIAALSGGGGTKKNLQQRITQV